MIVRHGDRERVNDVSIVGGFHVAEGREDDRVVFLEDVDVLQVRFGEDVERHARHPRLVLRGHEQLRVRRLFEIVVRCGLGIDDRDLLAEIDAIRQLAAVEHLILRVAVIARQVHAVIDVGEHAKLERRTDRRFRYGHFDRLHVSRVAHDQVVGDQRLPFRTRIECGVAVLVEMDVELGAAGPAEDQMAGACVFVGVQPNGRARGEGDVRFDREHERVARGLAVHLVVGRNVAVVDALGRGPIAQRAVERDGADRDRSGIGVETMGRVRVVAREEDGLVDVRDHVRGRHRAHKRAQRDGEFEDRVAGAKRVIQRRARDQELPRRARVEAQQTAGHVDVVFVAAGPAENLVTGGVVEVGIEPERAAVADGRAVGGERDHQRVAHNLTVHAIAGDRARALIDAIDRIPVGQIAVDRDGAVSAHDNIPPLPVPTFETCCSALTLLACVQGASHRRASMHREAVLACADIPQAAFVREFRSTEGANRALRRHWFRVMRDDFLQ